MQGTAKKASASLALHLLISPQRNCQILRSLSPSLIPFAFLNLAATLLQVFWYLIIPNPNPKLVSAGLERLPFNESG